MALIVPKVVYPTGGGTTFTFTFPPRLVPYKVYEAVRHDNLSSAGVKESIYERTDEFLVFTMENVKAGSDISGWDSFIQSALQGIPFDYYPDSTVGSFTTYVFEGFGWSADFKSVGMYTFGMRFRKRVNWP